jgi:cell division protease FtsH
VRRIVDASIEAVRQILDARRAALEAVTRRLMEAEVIDGEELRALVEASTGTPQLVPGTATERRPARPPAAGEQPEAALGGADG